VVDFFLPKTFSSGMLATSPLPPTPRTIFATSIILWAMKFLA